MRKTDYLDRFVFAVIERLVAACFGDSQSKKRDGGRSKRLAFVPYASHVVFFKECGQAS